MIPVATIGGLYVVEGHIVYGNKPSYSILRLEMEADSVLVVLHGPIGAKFKDGCLRAEILIYIKGHCLMSGRKWIYHIEGNTYGIYKKKKE